MNTRRLLDHFMDGSVDRLRDCYAVGFSFEDFDLIERANLADVKFPLDHHAPPKERMQAATFAN